MARTWNADNNLWYEDGEPVAPARIEAEDSVQEFNLPTDTGETEQLRNEIEELKRLVSDLAGAKDNSAGTNKDAGSTSDVSL